MSATPSARPIWLPVLYEGEAPAVTLLGTAPFAAKGAECRFMISLFEELGTSADAPGTLFDTSNFVSFILKIWATDFGSGTLLADTSDAGAIAAGASVTFNPTATAAEFYGRVRSQIEVYLPASVTANITAGARYGVLTGATSENAAQPDWFGNFNFTSKEVGLGTVATAPSPSVDYVRSDIFAAALAQKVNFGVNPRGKFPILVNNSGAYGTAIRTGDNGEWLEEQITNP